MTNIKDNRLIDGIVVKKRIIAEIKQYAENFTKMPSLVSILIGDVPEAAVYVRNQARGAEQAGMPFKQVNWPSDITQDECKARILALNDDANSSRYYSPKTCARPHQCKILTISYSSIKRC